MSFAPIITPSSTPIVSISPSTSVGSYSSINASGNVTYSQILASLGTMVYGAEFIYLSSDSYTQVAQTFQYLHFDSNGNQIVTYLPFVIDPYQNQPAIYYETNEDEIVLDGFSSLTFSLEPNKIVYFKAFTLVESNSLQLNDLHNDAFQDVEEAEGVQFFKDFCNYLIDEEDATKA